MTTLFITAIVILLVIALAARINIVREATLALILSAGLLWIISNHSGDVHYWAPYVVGFMMVGAAIRWIYTLFGSHAS